MRDAKGAQPILDKQKNSKGNKSVRRMKGHASAQDIINEIYEMKLFQLLNESSKGTAGNHLHRATERREAEK